MNMSIYKFNVFHGHIHRLDAAPGPYLNVCVEKTDYKPIPLESLRRSD